jgi:hypothetical protein
MRLTFGADFTQDNEYGRCGRHLRYSVIHSLVITALLGRWQCKDSFQYAAPPAASLYPITYVFSSDGTGSLTESGYVTHFTYTLDGHVLIKHFEHEVYGVTNRTKDFVGIQDGRLTDRSLSFGQGRPVARIFNRGSIDVS